ncbi:MAG: hypothetical protein ACI8RZ_005150 [Myxococcota bacterium]|jgi:hypothetical protein
MSCDHTRAVLQGEAPLVDTTDHLTGCADCSALAAELLAVDAAMRSLMPPAVPADLLAITRTAMAEEVVLEAALATLNPPPVPADLLAATRAAMAAEVAGRRPVPDNVVPLWRRGRLWAGLAAAAALVLLITPPTTAPADPDSLFEKGVGGARPDVALGVAVQSGDSTTRLRADRRYAPGDVLFFRSSADRTAEVILVRIDATGAAVIHQDQVNPGDQDLPLSWTLESGEGDAIFALVASSEPVESEQIESALSPTWPEPPCETITGLGLSCESVFVGLNGETQ